MRLEPSFVLDDARPGVGDGPSRGAMYSGSSFLIEYDSTPTRTPCRTTWKRSTRTRPRSRSSTSSSRVPYLPISRPNAVRSYGGVVVDVQIGVGATPFDDEVDDALERRSFADVVVTPERLELEVAGRRRASRCRTGTRGRRSRRTGRLRGRGRGRPALGTGRPSSPRPGPDGSISSNGGAAPAGASRATTWSRAWRRKRSTTWAPMCGTDVIVVRASSATVGMPAATSLRTWSRPRSGDERQVVVVAATLVAPRRPHAHRAVRHRLGIDLVAVAGERSPTRTADGHGGSTPRPMRSGTTHARRRRARCAGAAARAAGSR